jgi:hypothetical protein
MERSLADLGRFFNLPGSANVVDRHGEGPLEHFITPQPVHFAPNPLANPMQERLPSAPGSLAALAGVNDIADPDFDERLSAAGDAFSRVGRPTAMHDFQASLGMQEMLRNLMSGHNSPLMRRR